MADYVFTFPPDAAGLDVTVTDGDDQTVSTQTLGSETNASDVLVLELQLDPGNYTGTVELATAGIHNRNPAEWRFYSDRIESTGIALPEDLSGGSGVILDGAALLFEINNGATVGVSDSQEFLSWDTAPGDITPGAQLHISPGLYLAALYIDLATFADDLTASLAIGANVSLQPISLPASSGYARTLQVTGLISVIEGSPVGAGVGFSLTDTGSTTEVDVSYASLALIPITG